MANNNGFTRHHFIVSKSDTAVENWIKCQQNFSASMRALIRWCIAKQGMTDIMCSIDMGSALFGIDATRNNDVNGNKITSTMSDEIVTEQQVNENAQTTSVEKDESKNNIADEIMRSLLV